MSSHVRCPICDRRCGTRIGADGVRRIWKHNAAGRICHGSQISTEAAPERPTTANSQES